MVRERACTGRFYNDVVEAGPASRRRTWPPGKPAAVGRRLVPVPGQAARVTTGRPWHASLAGLAGQER